MIEIINQLFLIVTVLLSCYFTTGMLLTFFKKDSLRYNLKMKFSGKDYVLLSAYAYTFDLMGLIPTDLGYTVGVIATIVVLCIAAVVALISAI